MIDVYFVSQQSERSKQVRQPTLNTWKLPHAPDALCRDDGLRQGGPAEVQMEGPMHCQSQSRKSAIMSKWHQLWARAWQRAEPSFTFTALQPPSRLTRPPQTPTRIEDPVNGEIVKGMCG